MPDNVNIKGSKGVLRSARIALKGRWKGCVSLTSPAGESISKDQWLEALREPEKLLSNPKKHLKTDENTVVAVYDLSIGGKILTVALKTHTCLASPINFLRTLLRDKSHRNYKIAAKLTSSAIPTAYPLAALTQKRGLLTVKTIFITEYIDSSSDLYSFLSENVSQSDPGDKVSSRVKKQAAHQIAHIFAQLDSIGLWHRDAKAGNFLVTPKGPDRFEVMLVDMDGIKPYFIRTARRRYLPFTKLGSVLIWHRGINLTDYLRSFRIYCTLTRVNKQKSDEMFRRITRSAVALRLLTFAQSAMKK